MFVFHMTVNKHNSKWNRPTECHWSPRCDAFMVAKFQSRLSALWQHYDATTQKNL